MKIANNIVEEIEFDQFYIETKNVLKPTIFIIKPWVDFLRANVKGTPIAFRITTENQIVYTYGFLLKKAGIKMFCAPFEGWNTPYIGFYSDHEILDYCCIIKSLYLYLRRHKKILYFEIIDKNIDCSILKKEKLKFEKIKNMNYDLYQDEAYLFDKLPRNLRKKIRNYSNQNYAIVESKPDNDFAELYYKQLIEVFALQKLSPFYSLEKVKSLFSSFEGFEDNILCLKSINTVTQEEIGTAIYFSYKDYAITFGSASFTSQKKTNMNHVVRWEAIRLFQSRGVKFFDFGGYNPYKMQFQPNILEIPRIYISRIPFLHLFRNLAKHLITIKRKVFKK